MCETIADTEASDCVWEKRDRCRDDDAEDQDDDDGDDDVLRVCHNAQDKETPPDG